jgi:predicted RNA binding protein with dsRBD fold (UPF0201 family)
VSGEVHANLEDLRRLQKAVDTAENEVTDAIRKLHRVLQQTDWKDSARRNFEEQLTQATSSVRQTTQRMSALKPILTKEISHLETYLRH